MSGMRRELQDYLDGRIGRRELPAGLREEARRWDAFLARMRREGPAGAPPWLEERIVGALPASAAGSGVPEPAADDPAALLRLVRWWTRPRTVRLSPLAGLAAAAALVLAVTLPTLLLRPAAAPGGPGAGTGENGGAAARALATEEGAAAVSRVYVQFSLRAPEARSVAVAGDFTDWQPVQALSDPDGDGVWTGRIPLEPGLHEYMFVVDGSRWVTDPGAERHVDDGFGNRNAVLAIPHAST